MRRPSSVAVAVAVVAGLSASCDSGRDAKPAALKLRLLEPVPQVLKTRPAAGDERSLRRLAAALAATPGEGESLRVARAAVAHALSLATGSPRHALEALDLLVQSREDAGRGGGPPSSVHLFDRAVVLADLGLCHLAAQAFALAAVHEVDETWRDEIAGRLAGLPCRHVAAPGSTLDAKIDAALDLELQAVAARLAHGADREGTTRLAALGAALAAGGEPLVAQVAAELADGQRMTDPAHRRAVADAAAGRTAFLALDYARSRTLFEGSCPALADRRSALAGWCRFWLLASRIYQGELSAASDGLAQLRAQTESPYLRGRTAWSEGLARFRGGSLGAAHDLFLLAARELSRVRLTRSHAAVEILRAEVLSHLGAWEQAARVRGPALVTLQGQPTYFALLNGLIDGANDAHTMGLESAADNYLVEAALLAREQGNVITQTEIKLLQGDLALQARPLLADTAAVDDARGHFLGARRLAASIGGPLIRTRHVASADLGLAEANDAAASAPAALLALADWFAVHGPRSNELRALGRLHEVAEAAGDRPLARRAYERAYDVIAAQRAGIRGIEDDAGFLASQRAFFDRAIAAALLRGDAAWALSLVADALPEGGAASSLPVAGRSASERTLRLPARPDRQVAIVYRFLGDRLVWWSWQDNAVRHGALADVGRLRALVADLRVSAGRPADGPLEEAFQLLLAEPLRGVEEGRPLVLVPDGELAAVPFAALREPGTGVRLIQRHPLQLAMNPRATAPHPSPTRPLRVAVVGDPAFDRAQLPWLSRLPGARDEAREVAAIYGSGARLLGGAAATAAAVRDGVHDVAVLHVAAHAFSGDTGDVALVLAQDRASGSSGLSSADEVMAAGGAAELVVLSACATLDARRSDGLLGLAGLFLARGTSAVLGTLWPVDDREVARWVVEFHRLVAAGNSASSALQQVQARAAASEPCCPWAALSLVGDVTLPAGRHSTNGRADTAVRDRN